MIQRIRVLSACVIAAGTLGCGGKAIEPPPPKPVCTGTVTIAVTMDTIPTFSWTPDCTVGKLTVEQGVDEYWGTETLGADSYQSPITYGVNPPDSAPEEMELPLARGETYTVSLFRWISVVPESLELVGARDFTTP